MIKAIRNKIARYIKQQDGIAFPAVLVMFAVGSLIIVPSIRYVATNVNFGIKGAEEFKAILAADAGIEDALWKIQNDTPDPLPYSYQLTGINGFTVDVEIDEVAMIAGEVVGKLGTQEDRLLLVGGNVTYNDIEGNYDYYLILQTTDITTVKIDKIMIVFPPGVGYVAGSTSSNVTQPPDADPAISGTHFTGEILTWDNSADPPKMEKNVTEYHLIKLSGPPGLEDLIMESLGFVEGQSGDVGTVWINDLIPYTITAEASAGPGDVVATIRAGACVDGGTTISIDCWQIIP